ncbi:MAG TPA: hypothetical protein PL045_00070, partial [Chitinophagaceae bacterium]|nr:hypothetical protein [Chitinophagaceae bacterium]
MNGNIFKRIVWLFAFYFFSNAVLAQNNAEALQNAFNNYQSNNFREKVFVHTDKTFYLAGENIWFKVYCMDAFFHKPSPISKIVYVEIISKEDKPLLQAKIALDSGSGTGSFILPSFAASGNYMLRAYTSFMKNGDADFYYHQQLTIVNTFKSAAAEINEAKPAYDVQFFPEAGNMVEGIPSKIAFKVTDASGNGVDCSGAITDESNQVITNFQSLKFGMGNFMLTPVKGASYKATIKIGDAAIEKQLPQAYTNGYTMAVTKTGNEQILVNVKSNITAANNAVYLFVHAGNAVASVQSSNIINGSASFIIDAGKLSEGISHITLFNADRKPLCERLYFKKPAEQLHITLQSDKQEYEKRKSVNIKVSASESNADMSMSVFMIDSLQPLQYNDIFSYTMLTSELKGKIESPEYYFQNDSDDAADNLMLTQGWRRFKWEDVLQNKKAYFEFLPEHESFVISGKITGRNNGLPAQGINAVFTVPGENFQLAGAASNSKGELQFNMKNFYGANNIIVQADSNYKVEILPSYSNRFSSATTSAFKLSEQYKEQLLMRSISMQAENAYLAEIKQRSYSFGMQDTAAFYGKPDRSYNLDDYTRFITMEEVMREYVTDVRVRKEAQQYHFKVHNLLNNTYFDDDPLILLDGLPVNNTNRFMEFDPLKIKKIDVVSRRYYYGNIVADGIVSCTTYKGDLAGYTLSPGEVAIEFEGLQREREFYSPAYNTNEQIENRIPDLRNVLQWSPHLLLNAGAAAVNFFTSDVAGKYAVL